MAISRASTDGREIEVQWSDEVPPFIRIADQAYDLKRYLESRLMRLFAAAPTGTKRTVYALDYVVHQHTQTQFGDQASPYLAFTGVIHGIWTAGLFGGSTTLGFSYEVLVSDTIVTGVKQIRLPAN